MVNSGSLQDSLETMARQAGADLFGVADLSPAQDFIVTQARKVGWAMTEKILPEFPRAVSVGIRLADPMVESMDPALEIRGGPYGFYVYEIVNPQLNSIAVQLGGLLQRNGHRVFTVAASQPVGQTEGVFSHKLAAHLAGHGWIGKSCLLITPEYGPRVRFVTLLTDAPLEAGKPLDKHCGKCRDCVDACPSGAFSGEEFRPTDPREVRFAATKCAAYRNGNPNDTPRHTRGCGFCVVSCPVGSKRSRTGNTGTPVTV